jgi:hypothetical protein
MPVMEEMPSTSTSDPVAAARVAIWRLFQEGYVDEDMATAGLLAVDLGTRRAQRKLDRRASRRDETNTTD